MVHETVAYEESVDRHMATLRELEQLARNCYAETIDHLSQEKFLVTMLIDGCFVFEFFRKYNMEEPGDKDDPLMESDWIQFCLQRELLLLENQLLFFVLNELYELTKGLIDIATTYFKSELGDSSRNQILGESKHLLHLMHTCWTASLHNGRRQNHRTKLNMFVSTATELRESGVKLRVRQACDLMDLKFEDEILEILIVIVEDTTESLIRNLIAYEQHLQGGEINYVTEYMSFMDCLSNSSKTLQRTSSCSAKVGLLRTSWAMMR
ncbi:UPF0481 protein At3g47200-like [Eucalyptus grandis]|uniref:UPF0481 protein At3g47200-like n=1 Tax=Eucalyptus grandis TaxID=71139 RepID=UPI0005271D15|nr:UPF0481 protein At3g47200-like [Eucalyptus grandis]